MSQNLPNPPQTDEIDLGQLFNAIGRIFQKLFDFIGSIFKALFSVIIFALKAIIDNWKILAIALVVAFIAGKFYDSSRPTKYVSEMLVKPYFDSKYQLIDNIDYYNSLLGNQDYKTMSSIFEVDQEIVEKIEKFEIEEGPETEMEIFAQYDKYLKTIDSTRAKDVTFERFINDRDIYSVDFYRIKVSSFTNDIFPLLEKGLNSNYTNQFSIREKRKRDSILNFRKQSILTSLDEIKELKDAYLNVLEEEAKSTSTGVSIGDLSLKSDKTETREIELLNEELRLLDELNKIEEARIKESEFFDVVSGFQKIGKPHNPLKEKYTLIFPAIAFILLSILFLAIKLVKYVQNYKG